MTVSRHFAGGAPFAGGVWQRCALDHGNLRSTRDDPPATPPGGQTVSITVANIRDVAEGTQPGQFTVGDRGAITSLADLDPIYRQLLDEPVTATVAVVGRDSLPNLTPVWFDYEGELVLLNLAHHRKKVDWLRATPHATFLLMNPQNTYHWVSIKTTVSREIPEDHPQDGSRVTDHVDRIWRKYTGQDSAYGLRDESVGESRILFELSVDKIATFGRP
jgi:PPOX class probable F420-dependent enzyme